MTFFGTDRQLKLWDELGGDRAWLYLGYTVEIHIFDGDERIAEIAILGDDKTAVILNCKGELPEDVRETFKKHGYVFKNLDELTPEQLRELGLGGE